MFEATTHQMTRKAIERAHEARAEAITDAWNWLFGGKSRG